MRKLTVQEYAKLMGVSNTIVYRKIKRGELATKTEIINNREVAVILVEESDIKHFEDVSNSLEHSSLNSVEQFQTPVENILNAEFIQKMYEDNMKLVEDVKNYAELAGQTKLLTDSEHRTQQQYFELQQENKMLIQENAILKTKNELIADQNEQYKKQIELLQEKITELELQFKDLNKYNQPVKTEVVSDNKPRYFWQTKL